jgi:signal peptidase I
MRNLSLNMQPAFQDGDLIFFYRIVDSFQADDAIVITYKGKKMTERVVATAGDSVDITADGLVINGSAVQERFASGETALFEEGITFPITVPDGEIFVLGDNRMTAIESRLFGCISQDAVDGKIIGLFRRRNF